MITDRSSVAILSKRTTDGTFLAADRIRHDHHAAPRREKIGRNQPCPCGSGKKYKKCCLQ
jgi:uncharacterized protein YecA (UPF0149 family)